LICFYFIKKLHELYFRIYSCRSQILCLSIRKCKNYYYYRRQTITHSSFLNTCIASIWTNYFIAGDFFLKLSVISQNCLCLNGGFFFNHLHFFMTGFNFPFFIFVFPVQNFPVGSSEQLK